MTLNLNFYRKGIFFLLLMRHIKVLLLEI